MSTKDTVDIALKYAELYTKIGQLFILVNVAIGGWLISSGDIFRTAQFSEGRIAWVVLYTGVLAVLWIGLTVVVQRLNACFKLARNIAEAEGLSSNEIDIIAGDIYPWITMYVFPVMVVIIDIAILLTTI